MNIKRYIDVIDKLIHSYNHTWHRSIKMKPASVNLNNQEEVWVTLIANDKIPANKPNFKVGDTVRIRKEKIRFEKEYEQNWTIEIFTIHKIIPRVPVVYKLKDLAGEVIKGIFYKEEFQKVSDSGYYPVEKVIQT